MLSAAFCKTSTTWALNACCSFKSSFVSSETSKLPCRHFSTTSLYFSPVLEPRRFSACLIRCFLIACGSVALEKPDLSRLSAGCQSWSNVRGTTASSYLGPGVPLTYLKKNHSEGVDVVKLVRRLTRMPLPVWMAVDVSSEAVVRVAVREEKLRTAEFEAHNPRLREVESRLGYRQ